MATHKLHWVVLSGITLVLLAMTIGPGVRHADAQTAAGAGLEAQYFDNKNLTAPKLTRTDARVDFS